MVRSKEQNDAMDAHEYRVFWQQVFFMRMDSNKDNSNPLQAAIDDADTALDALKERKVKFDGSAKA